MRAKKIYETLEFEEDMDPYKALNIGQWSLPFEKGDKIEILRSLYYDVDKYSIKPTDDQRFYPGDYLFFNPTANIFQDGLSYIRLNWVLDNTHVFSRIKK